MTTPTQTPSDPSASDARWLALADAELVDELRTPAEREFLATHVARSPAVRAEQQIRRALPLHIRDEVDDHAADEATIAATVAAFLADPNPATTSHHADVVPLRRRTRWLAAGLALAAGVTLVWATRPGPTPAMRDPLTVLSGPLQRGETQAVPGDSLAARDELRTADVPACVGADGRQRVCLGPHSRARTTADGALELLSGTAEVSVEASLSLFVVQVAGVRLTSDGGAFTVTVETHHWTASATRGTVQLADADGPLARLAAGDSMRRGLANPPAAGPVPADSPSIPVPADSLQEPVPADSPAEPVPTDSPPAAVPADSPPAPTTARARRPARSDTPPAADLLATARAHRAAGRTQEAVRAYQRLISAHPESPLAGTAQLALGQLLLGPAGDAKAALRAFDGYLALGGPLAEEASHGRIQALQRLGWTSEARAAIDQFLARYPASSYADALRRQVGP